MVDPENEQRVEAARYRAAAVGRRVSRPEEIAAVAERIVAGQRFCVLVTRTGDELPGARVLQPVVEDDFSFRLGTSAGSRKLGQLAADPRCLLMFTDLTRGAQVVCECAAEIIRDEAVRRDTFLPTFHAFWPDGPDDPDFCAVRCVTEALEVWDQGNGVAPDPFGLVSARLTRTPSGWAPERV